MPQESRKVSRALLQKGFRESPNAHHNKFWLYIGEKRQAIYTYLSKGASHTLPNSLCATMARQLKLSSQEFTRLIECSLDGPSYLSVLESKGVDLD